MNDDTRAPGLKTEEATRRMLRHVDWTRGAWISFVFTIAPPQAHLLQTRMGERLEQRGREQRVLRPPTPDALQCLVPTILNDPASGCIWVEAIRQDRAGSTEWHDAWVQLILRLNERRERLREALDGGLVIVAHPSMKSAIRTAGPDLWSIRTRVFELPPPATVEGDVPTVRPDRSVVEVGARDRWSDEQLLDAALERWEQLGPTQTAAQQATTLLDLARRLVDVGRLEQAVEATQKVVDIRRGLAVAEPDAAIADALRELGVRLHSLGRVDDAIDVARESLVIERELATARPGIYATDLAMGLHNLGAYLNDVGQVDDAIAATQEAISIYRDLNAMPSSSYLANLNGLAGALNNLATSLSSLGRAEESLAAVEEAVDIRRGMLDSVPGLEIELEADLAMGLNNLATSLRSLGRAQEALETAEEAAVIYRRLAQVRPHAYSSNLAGALVNLGNCLVSSGRAAAGLGATQEAVTLYRQLAQVRPAVHRANLARALANLGRDLAAAGHTHEALTATQEAVDVYEGLIEQRVIPAHQATLLETLNILAATLALEERRDAAIAVNDRATALAHALRETPEASTEISRALHIKQLLEANPNRD